MGKNSFITCLAAGVIILAVVLTDFPAGQKTPTKEINPIAQVEEFPIEEAPIPQPTSNSHYLLGIWQDAPMMGSGWSDHYNFYVNGQYTFYVSQMKCDKRIVRRMGGWIIDGERLILTTTKEERLVGGKMEPASGSCGTPISLEGATYEMVELPKPTVETAIITRIKGGEEDIHETIMMGNKQFWKFDDDPTGQGEFELEN